MKKDELKKIFLTIENALDEAEKYSELIKINERLLLIIEGLEYEIHRLNSRLGFKDGHYQANKFKKNPSSFLEYPLYSLLSNAELVNRYFWPFYDFLKHSKCTTLKDFFDQSDDRLLQFRGLGKGTLNRIRQLQESIYNNSVKRIFIYP